MRFGSVRFGSVRLSAPAVAGPRSEGVPRGNGSKSGVRAAQRCVHKRARACGEARRAAARSRRDLASSGFICDDVADACPPPRR